MINTIFLMTASWLPYSFTVEAVNLPTDAKAILKEVLDRAECWTGRRMESLKSLRYEYHLGSKDRSVDLVQGVSTESNHFWYGTTLQSGIHALARDPDAFEVTIEAPAAKSDPKTITLICKRRDPNVLIPIAIGNGISGSWSGYFSYGARSVILEIDRDRYVPISETIDSTKIHYSEWTKVNELNDWIPKLVSIHHEQTQGDMFFDWIENTAWLMRYTESGQGENKTVVARASIFFNSSTIDIGCSRS